MKRKKEIKYENSLAYKCPELAAQWHPTANGDLTPEKVTPGSGKKVTWIYPYDDPLTGKHFDFVWEANILNRVKVNGCPYLSGHAVWPGYNDLATRYPEIAKEWHYAANGDLTPKDVTPGSNKKVTWMLPYDDPVTGKHFDFVWEETIQNRVKGNGCPYLSGRAAWPGYNDLATRYPEIAKEWNYAANGDLTPKDVTPGSNKKVTWMLPYDDPVTGKHFDFVWEETIQNRVKGNGCPYFYGHAVWPGYNDLATKHPEIAKEWNYAANGDLTPEKVTSGSHKVVVWIYPYDDPITGKHFDFEWEAMVSTRTQGNGCPQLNGLKVEKGFNDLASRYPEIAAEWDYEENGSLTPEDVTYCSGKKVWWKKEYTNPKTGKKHIFKWQASVANRKNGKGCPQLNGLKVEKGFNDLASLYPEIAAEWDYEKNGSLTPEDVTYGSKKKVWWKKEYTNPKTGKKYVFKWDATIFSRVRGAGCPQINGQRKVEKGYNDLQTMFPEVADEWHETKNRKLTPQMVFGKSAKIVWWRCPHCGREYRMSIHARTSDGRGCNCDKKSDYLFDDDEMEFVHEHA